MRSRRVLFGSTLLATLFTAALFLNDPTVGQTKKKIGTDYTEETTPAASDYFHMVKSGGGAGTDRKVQFGNVPKALLASIANGHLLYNNNGVFGSPIITSPLTAENGAVSVAGLSSIGTATYIPRVNAAGTAWEYRSPAQMLADISALSSTIPGSSTELLYRSGANTLGATTATWDSGTSTLTTGTIKVANSGAASELQLLEPSGSGTNYTAFKTQAQAGNVTYTLPTADGTATYQLSTDGSGNLSWTQPAYSGSYAVDADISGITGTPRAFASGNNAAAFNNVSAAVGDNAYGTGLHAFKTRAASGTDANTIVNNDDTIAEFVGYGADGVVYRNAARILFKVDGTPGSGDMPGAILFDVTADGANSPTRILKLGSNGHASLGGGTSASELRFLEPTGSGANYTGFKAQAQTGDVTYTLPAADGSNGQVLSTNGTGTLSWATSGGGLTKFTEAESTSSPNNTVYVDSLTAAGASTNADVAIVPKGTGALLAAIPNSLSSGGNKRGSYSVDLQLARNGASTVASGSYATVSGGYGNTASNNYCTVGGGNANVASGNTSTVPGGTANVASGDFSHAIGYLSKAQLQGQASQASGQFSTAGDAQTSVLVARRSTANDTPAELFLDASSLRSTIATDTTWAFTITVVARRTDANDESAAYEFKGCIDNNAGTTALVGSVTTTVLAEDTAAWDCAVTADNTNDALIVTVTGEAAKTIRWVARIELTQVTG